MFSRSSFLSPWNALCLKLHALHSVCVRWGKRSLNRLFPLGNFAVTLRSYLLYHQPRIKIPGKQKEKKKKSINSKRIFSHFSKILFFSDCLHNSFSICSLCLAVSFNIVNFTSDWNRKFVKNCDMDRHDLSIVNRLITVFFLMHNWMFLSCQTVIELSILLRKQADMSSSKTGRGSWNIENDFVRDYTVSFLFLFFFYS